MAVDATKAPAAGGGNWSRYWAAGHEHSCPTSFTGFYGENTQAFWRRQATRLTSADVVLELGCGSGALLRFLLSLFPEGQAPALHGVDAAVLPPRSAPGLTIHDRTPFSALPLPAQSVSLVASQYGIEYGNDDSTWTELLRVLRPRARVAFILHKRGSRLDRVAADEMVLTQAALAGGGVYAAARAMVPFLERAATPEERAALADDPRAEAVRARFNAASQALVGTAELLAHGESVHEILGGFTHILGAVVRGGGTAALTRLDAFAGGLADHLARIAALRASALDVAGVDALRRRLVEAKFRVDEAAILLEQEHEMGWILEGARDAV